MIKTLENMVQKLELCKSHFEILGFIKTTDWGAIFKVNEQKITLASLLCEKIFTCIISKGRLPEREFLLIFGAFYGVKISDTRFSAIKEFANSNFKASDNDNEKILLLDLIFLCDLLEGICAKEALERYIKQILLLNINALEVQKSHVFLLTFFDIFKIEFSIFESILKSIYADFSTLDPKIKRNVFNVTLQVFWNVAHFYNDKRWLNFYDIWLSIFYAELSRDLDLAIFLHFFIYHICGNSFETQEQWKKFNIDVTLKASSFYALDKISINDFTKSAKNENDKIKVGFLRDRLVLNSTFKVEYSFLKMLAKTNKFEISIYLLSLLEKSDNDKKLLQDLLELGVSIFDVGSGMLHKQNGEIKLHEAQNSLLYFNSHLQKARILVQEIAKNDLDLLISPNNGYGICDYVLSQRVCKKQVFWSHGNFVYDALFIDMKITHICGNMQKIIHHGVEFYGIPVKMDDKFYNPQINKNIIDSIRNSYKATKIAGSIGRLIKLDSAEFLQALVLILDADKELIFLACGGGNVSNLKDKIAKICQEMNLQTRDILSRIFFPGFVDSGIYGHVIDFWLDSFPLKHGESRIEFVAKNKLSLIRSDETKENRENRLSEWLKIHEAEIKVAFYANDAKNDGFFSSFEEFCNFVRFNHDLVAFDVSDYVVKAQNALKFDKRTEQKHLLVGEIIKAVNNSIRENLGLQFFLKL